MRKILTAALAAMTLGGAVAATTTPAEAAPFGFHGGFRGGGVGPGVAVGAGLLGLAVGASLAAPHYYGPAYYAGPVYGPAYGPYGYYGACRVHYRFDPYAGRYVPVERCY